MNSHELDNFWSRIFTFLPTPLKQDGDVIDEDCLFRMIDFQIKNGVDGICLFGSTGGCGSFSADEIMRTTKAAAKHAGGRLSILAGTTAYTTSSCVELSKSAQDAGCDGIIVLPVSYWALTPDEIYEHFKAVATSVSLPICVYNNPFTAVDIKPDLLARLFELPNISCVKDSSGDLSRMASLRRLIGDSARFIVASERTSLQAFFSGATTGWAPVCPNFVPKMAVEFFNAAVRERNFDKAQSLFDKLFPICEFIGLKTHIRVAHTGLDILGRPVGPPRRPIRMLNPPDREALRLILSEFDHTADVG